MDSKQPAPFSDVDAAIQTLRISRSLFLRLVKEGRLPKPIKVGNRSLWITESLINAVRNNKTDPSISEGDHA
jgi:predicted DNA-binding transcriptional regulator AlpA